VVKAGVLHAVLRRRSLIFPPQYIVHAFNFSCGEVDFRAGGNWLTRSEKIVYVDEVFVKPRRLENEPLIVLYEIVNRASLVRNQGATRLRQHHQDDSGAGSSQRRS
jgi:hypothetical protein